MAKSRNKITFKKNSRYYYPEDDLTLQFKEQAEGTLSVASTHYIFKVVGHDELDEFITTQPDEIYKNKSDYTKSKG